MRVYESWIILLIGLALLAAGCVSPPRPRDLSRVRAAMESSPPTTSGLTSVQLAEFESERVTVQTRMERVPFGSTLPPQVDVLITTRRGPITENEFARRYARVGGGSELADVVGWRKPIVGPLILLVGGAGAAAAITYAVAKAGWLNGGSHGDDGAPAGFTLGFAYSAPLAGGVFLVQGVVGHDGDPSDNRVTRHDLRVYAQRYNQLLLRRVRGGLSTAPPPPKASFAPKARFGLTPAGVGVAGSI